MRRFPAVSTSVETLLKPFLGCVHVKGEKLLITRYTKVVIVGFMIFMIPV